MKKAIFICNLTDIMAEPWHKAGYECWLFDAQHPEGCHRGDDGIYRVGCWLNTPEDIFRHTGRDNIAFVMGFPECTHLTVTGARWFESKREKNPLFQEKAMELVYLCRDVGEAAGCPWALENPVSVISSFWRPSDFLINPYEYGAYLPEDDEHPLYPKYIKPRDAYTKKTCLWVGGGFKLPEKKPVGPDGTTLVHGRHPDPKLAHTLLYPEGEDRAGEPMYDERGYPDWNYSLQHSKLGGKDTFTKNVRSATPRGFALAVFMVHNGLCREHVEGIRSRNLLELLGK